MKIVLQPSGSVDSLAHLKETVEEGKPLEQLRDYIAEDLYKELFELHPNGKVHVWGVTPTHYKDNVSRKSDPNRSKWLKIDENETFVLFSKDNFCFAQGLITRIVQNKQLARHLWGLNENGDTWEYVYFFKDYKSINLAVKDINNDIGYKENNKIQGFSVLDESNSQKVWKLLGNQPQPKTIAEVAQQSLMELKKPSIIDTIKEHIISHKYYDFGVSKNNISNVIRIALERHSDNSNRTDIRGEQLFHRYPNKTYGLLKWFVQDILENQEKLPEEIDMTGAPEGAKKTITVNVYERDPKNREKCIKHYGATCVVCNFNFEEVYGALGKGYIHVHHLKPLGEIGEQYHVDPIEDLRPVCPNCHAMLHRKKEAIGIMELQNSLIKK